MGGSLRDLHNPALLMSPEGPSCYLTRPQGDPSKDLERRGTPRTLGFLASPLSWPSDVPCHFLGQSISRNTESPSCLPLWVRGGLGGVRANTADIPKLHFLFQLLAPGTPGLKSGVITSQGELS